MDSPKYERTYHLAWSPGGTADDKRMKDTSGLIGTEIVITEKMDGSNVCMETDACFARTHSGPADHPSFNAFKALHSQVRWAIPDSVQVFGEWCFALHSIPYDRLPGYFLMFGERHVDIMRWQSWDEVKVRAVELGLPSVPELARVTVSSEKELRELTESLAAQPSACGGLREGVVVRVAHGFGNKDFSRSVAKLVRKNHVQTSEHWKNETIVRNKLLL